MIVEWREAKQELRDILSEEEYETPRDLAADREAIEAGSLNFIFLPEGGVGVDLIQGGETTLDLERMRRGELRLAAQMCEQLERLMRVGLGLLETQSMLVRLRRTEMRDAFSARLDGMRLTGVGKFAGGSSV